MKKILVLSLVLALALTLVMPSVAMAANPKPFSASGTFSSIDEGNVTVIGVDDAYQVPIFQVQDRHIQGEFARSVKGESNRVNGPFTITYDAVVNGYQMGKFSGILKAKSASFDVKGISYGVTEINPNKGYRIDLGGTWTGTQGIKGSGNFAAYFYFIPVVDEYGIAHVGAITDSSFSMTGAFNR